MHAFIEQVKTGILTTWPRFLPLIVLAILLDNASLYDVLPSQEFNSEAGANAFTIIHTVIITVAYLVCWSWILMGWLHSMNADSKPVTAFRLLPQCTVSQLKVSFIAWLIIMSIALPVGFLLFLAGNQFSGLYQLFPGHPALWVVGAIILMALFSYIPSWVAALYYVRHSVAILFIMGRNEPIALADTASFLEKYDLHVAAKRAANQLVLFTITLYAVFLIGELFVAFLVNYDAAGNGINLSVDVVNLSLDDGYLSFGVSVVQLVCLVLVPLTVLTNFFKTVKAAAPDKYFSQS